LQPRDIICRHAQAVKTPWRGAIAIHCSWPGW
jgi:hypothetical protein